MTFPRRAIRLRTATGLVVAAALAAAFAGCGDTTHQLSGSSGAAYLDLNHLKYQVQVSREMNQHDPEDLNYLVGLAPADRSLAPDQAWFAVFVSVYNRTKQAHLAARDFSVVDTQNNVYHPVPLALVNPFAYRQRTVAHDDQIPRQGSVPYYGPIGGGLVLFKLKLASFQNRPLTLRIADPLDPSVVATEPLDV